jgi:hypothetical protein
MRPVDLPRVSFLWLHGDKSYWYKDPKAKFTFWGESIQF